MTDFTSLQSESDILHDIIKNKKYIAIDNTVKVSFIWELKLLYNSKTTNLINVELYIIINKKIKLLYRSSLNNPFNNSKIIIRNELSNCKIIFIYNYDSYMNRLSINSQANYSYKSHKQIIDFNDMDYLLNNNDKIVKSVTKILHLLFIKIINDDRQTLSVNDLDPVSYELLNVYFKDIFYEI